MITMISAIVSPMTPIALLVAPRAPLPTRCAARWMGQFPRCLATPEMRIGWRPTGIVMPATVIVVIIVRVPIRIEKELSGKAW